MEHCILTTPADLDEAADLAQDCHERLHHAQAHLPSSQADGIRPRLDWIAQHGRIAGLRQDGALRAFWGAFPIEGWRNVGKAAYSPDWSHGVTADAGESGAVALYRLLWRHEAEHWRDQGCHIHSAGAYVTDSALAEALGLLSFGRIMMEAAFPTGTLAATLGSPARSDSIVVRRALPADARLLAGMNRELDRHIAASPIFFPDPHGLGEEEWREWLPRGGSVAFIALTIDGPLGYIKAEAPQIDVSWSVHGSGTLAINGMFVDPAVRGRGIATSLLAALVAQAASSGKTLVSVDCETANLEALGFWSRWFLPFAYGWERRI